MSTVADSTIAALRSGHDELAALVKGLTLAEVSAPSGAEDWNLAAVLSHLGSGAVISLAGLDSALTGGGPRDPGFNRSVWDRWDAFAAQEQVNEYLVSNAALVERYESLDVHTRESLRIDMGFLPEPVDLATAAGFRLMEFALHSLDVRVGLDPNATVRAEAVPLLLPRISSMFGWLAKTGALAGRSVSMLVELHEPTSSFGLQLGEAPALVEAPASPDATLTASAEAWVRLATGRLSAAHTPTGVEVTGDIDLDTLRAVFPGF